MMLNNSWLAGSVIGLVMGRRAAMRGVAYTQKPCVYMRVYVWVCVCVFVRVYVVCACTMCECLLLVCMVMFVFIVVLRPSRVSRPR